MQRGEVHLKPSTFAHQQDLPSLPLPPLDETLDNLIASVTPLCSAADLHDFTEVVQGFKERPGPALQQGLETRRAELRNWLADWWLEHAYLRTREPNAFNVNWYGGCEPLSPCGEDMDQAEAAAYATYGMLNFYDLLASESLPPDKARGQPVCMEQYRPMFNSTVVPHAVCDELRHYPVGSNGHIVVVCSGYTFVVPVRGDDRMPSPGELYICFSDLLRMCSSEEGTRHLGQANMTQLTCLKRPEWAEARRHLLYIHADNAEALEAMDTALFIVSLSDRAAHTPSELGDLCLLGDGRSKWHDKCINLVVSTSGRVGMNGEHSFAEAVAPLRALNHMAQLVTSKRADFERDVNEWRSAGHSALSISCTPKPLVWKTDEEITRTLARATAEARDICAEIDVCVRQIGVGSAAMRAMKLGPDACFQMALQLASFRVMNGTPVAVYESCSHRKFFAGRTDTIRSTTSESVAFARAVHDGKDQDTCSKLLKRALNRHLKSLKQGSSGYGIDRHLLGLQIEASARGEDVAQEASRLFGHPVYLTGKRFKVSTSNVSGAGQLSCAGFAPTEPDGFGCCYSIRRNNIVAGCSSRARAPHSASEFADHLQLAVGQVMKLWAHGAAKEFHASL
ncbi:unnamed protein product [Chrysoparadoxa australica]